MEQFNLAFIFGALLYTVPYVLFMVLSNTVMGKFDPTRPTYTEGVMMLSGVFETVHELGHALMAVLMGFKVESIHFHTHFRWVETDAGHELSFEGPVARFRYTSSVRAAIVALGPLLLWVPLALWLLKNPAFDSAIVNGLVFALLMLSGLEVFLSSGDRHLLRLAAKPLAYFAAAWVLLFAGVACMTLADRDARGVSSDVSFTSASVCVAKLIVAHVTSSTPDTTCIAMLKSIDDPQ